MLLQPSNQCNVLIREDHVDAVEVVVDGARGIRVVEALYQRVELVLARPAHDLLTVEVVAHVIEFVIPLERNVADRVDGHLILRVGLLDRCRHVTLGRCATATASLVARALLALLALLAIAVLVVLI